MDDDDDDDDDDDGKTQKTHGKQNDGNNIFEHIIGEHMCYHQKRRKNRYSILGQ